MIPFLQHCFFLWGRFLIFDVNKFSWGWFHSRIIDINSAILFFFVLVIQFLRAEFLFCPFDLFITSLRCQFYDCNVDSQSLFYFDEVNFWFVMWIPFFQNLRNIFVNFSKIFSVSSDEKEWTFFYVLSDKFVGIRVWRYFWTNGNCNQHECSASQVFSVSNIFILISRQCFHVNCWEMLTVKKANKKMKPVKQKNNNLFK